MGNFQVLVEVLSPDRSRGEKVQAWVDTGATYSWLPESALRRLGYVPTEQRQFRLADGVIIERGAAPVHFRLEKRVLPSLCVFGDEGSEPLLGSVTLEEFGLGVDVINRKLVPTVQLMLGLVGRA